jgi:AraC-like DNA-binding protein
MKTIAPFTPVVWPLEVRFFPNEPSLSDPILIKTLSLPSGQMSAWSSSHPGCGIYVCTGPGSVMARIGADIYRIRKGEAILVPPGAPICWFCEKDRSELISILFRHSEVLPDMSSKEMGAFLACFCFGKKGGFLVQGLQKEFDQLIQGSLRKILQKHGQGENGNGLRRKIILEEILLQILQKTKRGLGRKKFLWVEQQWRRLPEVLSYLHRRYGHELYAAQIQKELNLPKNYLTTAFPLIMGQRWNQYLLDYRIRRAAILLLQDSSQVSSVALESGFSTLSHFNSSFRRTMGMPPRDFVSSRLKIRP